MENIYMLSDTDLIHRIGVKIRECRLKQNISQQNLAQTAGVSLSSVIRMEEGKIKSFDTFVRILRTLGKLEMFDTLISEEPISPNEYYQFVHSIKQSLRKRAAKHNDKKAPEEIVW